MVKDPDIQFQAKVAKWRKPRTISCKFGLIAMEVTRKTCRCQTCVSQLNHVKNVTTAKGMRSRQDVIGNSRVVLLERPRGIASDPKSLAGYVGQVLGLTIQVL